MRTVTGGRDVSDGRVVGLVRRNIHDDSNRKLVFESEIEVALVVRGDRHDRTGTVVREDIIGRPNRHALAVHRVNRKPPEKNTRLFASRILSFNLGLLLYFLEIRHERHSDGGVRLGDQFARKIGVGCDNHERRPVQRVRSSGEDGNGSFTTVHSEHHLSPARPPNPVALHCEDFRRPSAFESIKVCEETIGVIGDSEIPLRQLLLDDRCATALTRAVGQNLLVRENRLIHGIPVDPRVPAVGQTFFVQLEEQPLVPLVILGVRGVQHPRPVERRRVPLHRGTLLGDVFVGPVARVHAALDCRVFGRKSEGIPPDGVQNLISAKPPVPCEDVSERVDLGVTHVKVTRRVREHVQDVLVRARIICVGNIEGSFGFPHGRPLCFDPAEIVFVLVHGTPSPRAHARPQFYSVWRYRFGEAPRTPSIAAAFTPTSAISWSDTDPDVIPPPTPM